MSHRVWDACPVPWVPELFTAPVLQRLLEKRRRDRLVAVPFFDGLVAGEPAALVASFAGEPELYDPVRGRIRGEPAFRAFAAELSAWLVQRNVVVEDVDHVVLARRGFEEVLLRVDGETGRVDLPFAVVADHPSDGRIEEMRIYYPSALLSGLHASRPPLLQRDPELRVGDVVAEHQRALAAGDVDAIVATFEPDGLVRDPAGATHTGAAGLRAFYEQLFSNGGGVPLELCAIVDDGRACALEHNVVRWGTTELPPHPGVAVYVRGRSGRLAVARIYGDDDQPWNGV